MSVTDLPAVNALLNGASALLLLLGYLQIRRGRIRTHRRFMVAALVCSTAFLACYLVYHYAVGSVPYPHRDWTRSVYFAVLVPHIVLAAVNVPLTIALVWFALRRRYSHHRRAARWVWPSWMFVCASGIAVYLMLYHL